MGSEAMCGKDDEKESDKELMRIFNNITEKKTGKYQYRNHKFVF